MILALGDDIDVEGRSTYTPFVRGRQFAVVAPSTRTRVDLGLRFTDPPASDRCQRTHRVPTSVDQVDGELEGLIRLAYDQNA